MDVRFTLWSLREIIKEIPFDSPAHGKLVSLCLSKMAIPHYVKHSFRVSFIYDDNLPYDACCTVFLKDNIFHVVIIMKQQYEDDFQAYLNGNTNSQIIKSCCRRRELYSHETCHLVAIIRAFPSDICSTVKDEFIEKIRVKFKESARNTERMMIVPLASMEEANASPSVFDKDHFPYDDDDLNYFKLYQELMLSYDNIADAIPNICKKAGKRPPSFEDMEQVTFVSQDFFSIFPEKLSILRELLWKEIFK